MSKRTMDVDGGLFKEIKKIKFGGFSFDLRFVQDDEELTAKYVAAHTSSSEKISILLGSKTKGEAILHECCHNILIRIKSHQDDEDFNARLSYAFYAFMRDNPELIVAMLNENTELNIQFPKLVPGAREK